MKIFVTVKKNFELVGFFEGMGRFHKRQWARTVRGFLAFVMQSLYLPLEAVTARVHYVSM